MSIFIGLTDSEVCEVFTDPPKKIVRYQRCYFSPFLDVDTFYKILLERYGQHVESFSRKKGFVRWCQDSNPEMIIDRIILSRGSR